ncbi:MFS transporter [Galactobacter caseinivorans]|uniref:MFS transporter n=1 Tax=Galactobacter caseinivorans TaxID=2676123 RepID=A0A496PIC8_9MICC|nr:MFS transporter [Galactobacter caseinivorans]RKW70239.1 MFS transporter [Galactobacter caseinivorans]
MSTHGSAAPAARPHLKMDRKIFAWALWDWGSAAINAVMTTFVFTVYLTSSLFGNKDENAAALAAGLGITGVAIALVAPVLGRRADSGGRRKLWLGIHTGVIVLASAACFFVRPEHEYLILGIVLLCVATFGAELASVNYFAMLPQISTQATMGRVSGFGWACGYLGGIVALALVLFGFVQPIIPWAGSSDVDGLNLRLVAVFCAAWTLIFCLPVLFAIPELPVQRAAKVSVLDSYKELFARIGRMWREDRDTLWFLISSAVYRDGLAAVFTFGGVIAGAVFGMSATQVILFAIAGNVIAAAGALLGGWLDDKVGPRKVILACLIGLLCTGVGIFLSPGAAGFWVFGLIMCALVGPAQSASRSLLARRATPENAGEIFGLYATTGRAVSFLAPSLFALCTSLALSAGIAGGEEGGAASRYGIVGIMLVVAVGLVLFVLGRDRRTVPAPR